MKLNPFAIAGQLLATILPAPLEAFLRGIVDRADALLSGSPARAIGYGAAAVIYVVALALDRIPDMTPEQALGSATFAISTLVGIVEAIRRNVYSPATVAKIVATPPTAPGPIAAAVAEGVDAELVMDAVEPSAEPVPVVDVTEIPAPAGEPENPE